MELKKIWHVRDVASSRHPELDGVSVDIDDKFPNGLDYPCAPGSDPGDVVRCHCWVTIDMPDEDVVDDAPGWLQILEYVLSLGGKNRSQEKHVGPTLGQHFHPHIGPFDLNHSLISFVDADGKQFVGEGNQRVPALVAEKKKPAVRDSGADNLNSAVRKIAADAGTSLSEADLSEAYLDGLTGSTYMLSRSRFTDEEIEVVNRYSDEMYEPVNKRLRGKEHSGFYTEEALVFSTETLRSAISKSSLSSDTVVWRGMGSPGKMSEGREFTDKGFGSASLVRQEAERFADPDPDNERPALIKMTLPKGQNFVPGVPSEGEVILPDGMSYRIGKFVKDDSELGGYWEAEVIPTPVVTARDLSDLRGDLAMSKIMDEVRDWMSPLGSDEEYAVEEYSGAWAKQVNALLRESGFDSLDGPDKIQATYLDRAIAKGSLKEDTVVYRGLIVDKKLAESMKPGVQFVDHAWTSTTLSSKESRRFSSTELQFGDMSSKTGLRFRLVVPEGSPVGYGNESEGEIILPRDMSYEVGEYHEDGDYWELEIINAVAPGVDSLAEEQGLASLKDYPSEPQKPQLLTESREAFDSGDWIFQKKYDGQRAQIVIQDGQVKIYSRTLQDITDKFPEMQGLAQELNLESGEYTLDGEIVAFDDRGVASIDLIQQTRKKDGSGDHIPLKFVAFDIVEADGKDLRELGLEQRLDLLRGVMPEDSELTFQAPEFDKGVALFEETRSRGEEGIVAKKRGSTYVSGTRSKDWVKVKNYKQAELVIGGWEEGKGERAGRLGSVQLGVYNSDGEFVYVGNLGSGISGDNLDALEELLQGTEADNPFTTEEKLPRGSHFVDPQTILTVEFVDLTSTGKLRQPKLITVRDDKKPKDVTLEELLLVDKPPAPNVEGMVSELPRYDPEDSVFKVGHQLIERGDAAESIDDPELRQYYLATNSVDMYDLNGVLREQGILTLEDEDPRRSLDRIAGVVETFAWHRDQWDTLISEHGLTPGEGTQMYRALQWNGSLKVGETFPDPGFPFATSDASLATQFMDETRTVVVITFDGETKVIPGSHANLAEYILPRDVVFRVDEIDESNPDHRVVNLSVVITQMASESGNSLKYYKSVIAKHGIPGGIQSTAQRGQGPHVQFEAVDFLDKAISRSGTLLEVERMFELDVDNLPETVSITGDGWQEQGYTRLYPIGDKRMDTSHRSVVELPAGVRFLELDDGSVLVERGIEFNVTKVGTRTKEIEASLMPSDLLTLPPFEEVAVRKGESNSYSEKLTAGTISGLTLKKGEKRIGDAELVTAVDESSQRNKALMEQDLQSRSRWNGDVTMKSPNTIGHAVGGVKEWSCSISLNYDYAREDILMQHLPVQALYEGFNRLLIPRFALENIMRHEMAHSMSSGSEHKAVYIAHRPWEEGLVELYASSLAGEVPFTYPQYTYPMKDLLVKTGKVDRGLTPGERRMQEKSWWHEMMKVPLAQREEWMAKLVELSDMPEDQKDLRLRFWLDAGFELRQEKTTYAVKIPTVAGLVSFASPNGLSNEVLADTYRKLYVGVKKQDLNSKQLQHRRHILLTMRRRNQQAKKPNPAFEQYLREAGWNS